MLDIALNHKEELIQKMNNTWFDDKSNDNEVN
jgi:hypothetical protein